MKEGLNEATLEDQDFIFELIREGAKNGHFNEALSLNDRRIINGLKNQLYEAITKNHFNLDGTNKYNSKVYTYYFENKKVGFCWVIERGNSIELLYLAVSQSSQKNGFGRSILIETINRFPIGTKFEARLYAPSIIMSKLLVSIGFRRSIKQKAQKTSLLTLINR